MEYGHCTLPKWIIHLLAFVFISWVFGSLFRVGLFLKFILLLQVIFLLFQLRRAVISLSSQFFYVLLWGWLVKGSGTHVVFSSTLPVARNDEDEPRRFNSSIPVLSLVSPAHFWVFLSWDGMPLFCCLSGGRGWRSLQQQRHQGYWCVQNHGSAWEWPWGN